MPRSRVRWLALVLLVLVAAGCELDATLGVDLAADGSGTLEVALRADRELLAQAAAAGAEPLGELARAVRPLEGWRVAASGDDDGGRTVRLEAEFTDAEAFHMLLGRFASALRAPELEVLGPVALDVSRDRLRLRGQAALAPRDAVEQAGMTVPLATAALADAVDYRVRVRVPGEVIDSNADEQRGRELIWHVPAGRTVPFMVEAARPVSRTWLLLAGGAVTAALTAVALRRRPEPAPVLRPGDGSAGGSER